MLKITKVADGQENKVRGFDFNRLYEDQKKISEALKGYGVSERVANLAASMEIYVPTGRKDDSDREIYELRVRDRDKARVDTMEEFEEYKLPPTLEIGAENPTYFFDQMEPDEQKSIVQQDEGLQNWKDRA